MARVRLPPMTDQRCGTCGGALSRKRYYWVDGEPALQCSRACAGAVLEHRRGAQVHEELHGADQDLGPLFRGRPTVTKTAR